jgi:ABC-type sugar transport system, periplasmic component
MKKRRITAIILSGIMATSLGLSGCSGSKKATEGTTPKSTSQTDSNVNATGLPIVKNQITLKIMAAVHPSCSPVYEDMPYFKNLEKLTNIKINWDTMANADIAQKESLMYASGDYPDAIMRATSTNDEEKYGVDQQILLPIEKYVNSIMPNYKKALESSSELKKMVTATDGHMYSTMDLYDMGYSVAGHYFVNKKWLDKLGLKTPKTVEDLENVLIAFKTKDPNGNGKADEIPFSSTLFNDTSGINNIFGMYGLSDTSSKHLNIDDNNKIVFVPGTDGYKSGLKLLNKFYSEGLIDQEMFTQDLNTYYAKVKTGNVGVFQGWRLLSYSYTYPGIDKDYVAIEPISAGDKKPSWLRSEDGIVPGAFTITKANKYPEATMRWVDAQCDLEMSFQSRSGLMPDYVKKNDQGKYELQTKHADGSAITNEETGKQAPGPNGVYTITPEQMKTQFVFAPQYAEKFPYIDMYSPYLQKNFTNTLGYLRFSSADTDKISRVSTDVNKYVTENVIQMITKGNIDASWDKYTSQFKNMGIDEYVKMYQTALDKYNSAK